MKPSSTIYTLLRTPKGVSGTRTATMNVCPGCAQLFSDEEKQRHIKKTECTSHKAYLEPWKKQRHDTRLKAELTGLDFAKPSGDETQLRTAHIILADFLEDQTEAEYYRASMADNILAGASFSGMAITGAGILAGLGKSRYDFRPKFTFSYTTPQNGNGMVVAANEAEARDLIAMRLNVERLPRGIKIEKGGKNE